MSIEAKAAFINRIETAISDLVTVSQANQIMIALSSELQGFLLEHAPAADQTDANDYLDAYISAKQISGKTDNTVTLYRYEIQRMMKKIGLPTRQITVFHLRKFLADEKARGLSDGSIRGLRDIIVAYFNWLQRESLIDRNPAANLEPIKCAVIERKPLSDVDMQKLKDTTKNTTNPLRDQAILYFLDATACRIGEVVKLNRDDLDLTNNECKVDGKGRKERIVFFDSVTSMMLQTYLDSRTDDNPALFINKNYGRLQAGGYRAMLHKVADNAGVDDVHPHRFRRTRATNLSSHGMSIYEVATLLGHSKIDTTKKYVILDKEDLRVKYRKCK